MADVIIRGMEMLKYTTKAEFGIDADGNPLCMVYHEDGTGPDIYDVVPLPEGHGRLGDLDKLEGNLRMAAAYQTGERRQGMLGCCETIRMAKSIVPAEGGGNNV